MVNLFLFYAMTAGAGIAAEKKRWGWCVVLSLIAIKHAVELGVSG